MYEITAAFRKHNNNMSWVADIQGGEFQLYVPKWRIPEPAPKKILIKIFSPNEEINYKKSATKNQIKSNAKLKHGIIYSVVRKWPRSQLMVIIKLLIPYEFHVKIII